MLIVLYIYAEKEENDTNKHPQKRISKEPNSVQKPKTVKSIQKVKINNKVSVI